MTSQEPVAEGIAQIIGWQRNCWGARQPEIHCLGCPGSHSWKDECTVAILCCKASQERCQEKQLATGHCWLLYTAAMEHLGDPILQMQDPSTGEIAPSWSPVGSACERDRSPFLLQYPSSALYWQSLTSCQLEKEKYLEGPGPFSRVWQERVNWVMRGDKLVTGIASVVEVIVGKGGYELLSQIFDWWDDTRKEIMWQFLFSRWKWKNRDPCWVYLWSTENSHSEFFLRYTIYLFICTCE